MRIEGIEVEEVGCLLCGANNWKKVFKGRDLLHDLPGEYSVVKCASCGMMQTNPRPTPESMAFYYPDNYGPYQMAGLPSISRNPAWWKKILRKALFRGAQFDTYFHALPVKHLKIGRALEVGCAAGGYMDELRDLGWKVEGIEFSPLAAQKARDRGHKVFAGSLETAPEPDKKFDLIVGWMVVEHLHQPKQSLVRLREWVADDGWLVFSVPNCDYFGWKLFKSCEYGAHIPAHLSHFTPNTISLMLDQSGWEVREILHQRVLGSIAGSIGFLLREKFGLTGSFPDKLINYDIHYSRINGWLSPISALLGFFGQTGRMTVWAKKRGVYDQ